MQQKPAPGQKVGIIMREFAKGKLHSGSARGPVVRDRQQAVAIALNQSSRTGKR